MIQLPHDELAEKSLIGSLLVDGKAFDEIVDLNLKKNDFHNPRFGMVFDAIKELSNTSRPVDYVTVCSVLQDQGKIEDIGGQKYILDIIEEQISSANVYHYGKSVKDKSSLRKIIRESQNLAQKGLNLTGSVEDYLTEVEATFFKLTSDAKTSGMLDLKSCLKANLRELEDTSRVSGEISGLPTGYGKLDQILLGLQPGQLVVLASRPAMGKTSLAMNMAINACDMTGGTLPVAVFSLEMMANELSMRLLSSEAKVDSKRLRTKNFLETDLHAIGNAVRKLSSLPIFLNDASNVTVYDIQSYCRKIKTEHGLGIVVIDYLQLMKPHNSSSPREQQIAEMSRSLKNLAKELECPILCLSQLNRSVESRPNKRPMLSDLRESGTIEQDADIVMMIYRDEFYNPETTKDPGVAEILVVKNRSGEQGTVRLVFKGAYTSFLNPDFVHESPR